MLRRMRAVMRQRIVMNSRRELTGMTSVAVSLRCLVVDGGCVSSRIHSLKKDYCVWIVKSTVARCDGAAVQSLLYLVLHRTDPGEFSTKVQSNS